MAQNTLSPDFCNGCCSSAFLFESAQSRPGDVEASEGKVATVKDAQHCIFSNLPVFNWSALYSALTILRPTAVPNSAPRSGSCPLWVAPEMLGICLFWWKLAAGPAPPVPFCFCRKSMVLCSIVDLSILRGWPWPCSMVQSSLMRTLNWSLLFFSDLLRDALGTKP